MYNHHERFFGRVAYWVMVLWSNQNFSVQTTLGTRPGLGNQTFYKIPSDQWLTSGERVCSLDNGPKVNHREIGDKAKTLKKKLCYTYRIWFKNTIVHNVVSRKFKLPFYRQPGHLVFDIFCSIFPNTDPSKHGINTEIISWRKIVA